MFDEWLKFAADILGHNDVFGKGARGLSHRCGASGFWRREVDHARLLCLFWYSVDGVWDKREKVDSEKRRFYMSLVLGWKADMQEYCRIFDGRKCSTSAHRGDLFGGLAHVPDLYEFWRREKRKTLLMSSTVLVPRRQEACM